MVSNFSHNFHSLALDMAPSRIFLGTVLAFLGGVLVQSFVAIPATITWFVVFAGLCGVTVGLSWRRMKFVLYGAFLLAFCFGIFRFMTSMTVPKSIANIYGERIEMRGLIWDEPRIKGQTQEVILKIIDDKNGPTREPFFLLIRTRPYPQYEIGTLLYVRGAVQKPESSGRFDYAAYLAKDRIYGVMYYPTLQRAETEIQPTTLLRMKKVLFQIKRAFTERLNAIIPEPHAAFLSGLLIGARSEIPSDIADAMQKTGTIHLVALSGFNISIIADNLLRALQWFLIPFTASFWIVVGFVLAFTVMTGASASLVRAAIMGILILMARKSGRLYDARLALVGAAGCMVLYEPGILRFDLGFQLSFLATLGIMFFSPTIEEYAQKYLGTVIAGATASTVGAQLAVLPLILYNFGGISIISPVANAAILLVIPLTMLVGFFAVVVGLVSLGAGNLAAILSWLLLEYEIRTIQFFAHVPLSYIEPPFLLGLVLAALYGWFLYAMLRRIK